MRAMTAMSAMTEMAYNRRRFTDAAFRWACAGAVLLALLPLVSVLYYTTARGIGGINLDFFTQLPKPVGETGGGMANAIEGTLVRFSADVMSGIPSITVGIFAYSIVVLKMGRFSALAGSVALAVIMLPTVTRTTEELLRLVPATLREAALGLGVSKWRATVSVVLRTALPGIATGIMLSVARVAGETAPLLFTAFNNRFWSQGVDQPIASLPVQIYTYAVSPFEDWHRQAWAAALVLVLLVLVLNVTAKLVVRSKVSGR